jgi:hypothetical protein
MSEIAPTSNPCNYFVCTPATLIDDSMWEKHKHTFDVTSEEDKQRAKRETRECKLAQLLKLGLEDEDARS